MRVIHEVAHGAWGVPLTRSLSLLTAVISVPFRWQVIHLSLRYIVRFTGGIDLVDEHPTRPHDLRSDTLPVDLILFAPRHRPGFDLCPLSSYILHAGGDPSVPPVPLFDLAA